MKALPLQKSKSHASLDAKARQDIQRPFQQRPPLQQYPSNDSTQSNHDPGPSNRRIHVISYPSFNSIPGIDDTAEVSPGSWSGSSDYSNAESARSRLQGIRTDSLGSGPNTASPVSSREMYGSQAGEARRNLLEPSTVYEEWPERDEARGSVTSGTTYGAENTDADNDPIHRTPMPPAHSNRLDVQSPRTQWPQQATSPARSEGSGSGKQTTPTRAGFPKSASPTTSGYGPNSGRLAFVAPPNVSQRSIDALEREVEAQGSDRMEVRVSGRDEVRRTAPAGQGEFGEFNAEEEEDENTLKGRKRRTLPAAASTSSDAIVEDMLSPDKHERQTPSRTSSYESKGSPSPARTPELPPRSTLRTQYVLCAKAIHVLIILRRLPSLAALPSIPTSPFSITPEHSHDPVNDPLPTIINTAYSPDPSPIRSAISPRRPDRSPERSSSFSDDRKPSFTNSVTINDLTDMLGGAIDAIGHVDSRDTPPPEFTESKKDTPNLTIEPLAAAAEVDGGPVPPTSLPIHNDSLGEQTPFVQPPKGPGSAPNQSIHRIPSAGSLKSTHMQSPTRTNISARLWPAAMLYGHVKTMKHAGDRAKGYARSINDLAKAETGLKEWCAASGQFFIPSSEKS